jgi:hypothetical protein
LPYRRSREPRKYAGSGKAGFPKDDARSLA